LAIDLSEEAYLVMDHQGFYSQSYNTFAKLNAFAHIISDSHPPQSIVDYCMENNILISCGS
jgi:DeoR/GlpR family transcriptional regulator of sugar metabolism